MPLLERDVEDRKPLGREELGLERVEPREDLALRCDRPHGKSRDVLGPRARGQHQPIRLDLAAVGANPHAALPRLPLEHPLARPHDGAVPDRSLHVRDDAALGQDEAAVGLVHELQVGRQAIRGKTPADLGAVERLVRKVVLVTRAQRPLEDPRSTLDRAGDVQQLLAGLPLELPPQLVGALHEGHVRGVLEVGEPDDARDPVRGAELVGDLEPLDAEHALAATERGDTAPRSPCRRPRRRRRRSAPSRLTLAQAG